MYYVKDVTGTIIAICSRLEDAQAMAASVGSEKAKTITIYG